MASKIGSLEGLTLKTLQGTDVVLSDLWKSQTVLLKVMRRFGCPLSRYEARLISELKPEFDLLNIKLVAVGFESVGLADFLTGAFWDWEVLIDAERNVHRALGLAKLPLFAGLREMFKPETRLVIDAAKQAGITGNLKGDSVQLGGLFVIEKGTGHVLYELRQLGAASCASLKEVIGACGGDPDEVEEKAPKQGIIYTRPALK